MTVNFHDYAMFSSEGNAAVHDIVVDAHEAAKLNSWGIHTAFAFAQAKLDEISHEKATEEAFDTAVRDEVWHALSKRLAS